MEKSRKWSYHFKIVYEKFSRLLKDSGVDEREISRLAMARFLDVSQGKMIAWEKGQWPSAEDLDTIARELGFSYRWLVTGEGDPFGDDVPAPKAAASCTKADPALMEKIASLEAELRISEKELRAREKELLEAKTEIIDLQRSLMGRR